MRIEVNNKKEFAKALQIGGMLAGTSRIMPILDCVKIKAKNDQLTFVSSDNENAISKRLTEGVVTEGEEVFCVNMKDLMSYVKLIKSERFEMVIDEKQLEVKHLNGNLTLPIYAADEFVSISPSENPIEVTLNSAVLSNWITDSRSFVANDEFRPIMNGMYVYCENGELGCCATDGQSLFTDNIEVENMPDFKFILSRNAFNPVREAIAYSEQINVKIGERNVMFTAEGASVIARQIEGRYVNFKSVIPTNNDIDVKVNKKELMDAMARCAVGANKASMLTKLEISGFSMNISCEDMDFSKKTVEYLAVEATGSITIGLKYSLIMGILNTIVTDDVIIAMKDPSRAVIFKDGDPESEKIMLLMPMMLGN